MITNRNWKTILSILFWTVGQKVRNFRTNRIARRREKPVSYFFSHSLKIYRYILNSQQVACSHERVMWSRMLDARLRMKWNKKILKRDPKWISLSLFSLSHSLERTIELKENKKQKELQLPNFIKFFLLTCKFGILFNIFLLSYQSTHLSIVVFKQISMFFRMFACRSMGVKAEKTKKKNGTTLCSQSCVKWTP